MDELRSWWEVPSIAHYCSLFRTAFDLSDFDIEDLEEALLESQSEEGSEFLNELVCKLLNGCYCRKDITTQTYNLYIKDVILYKWKGTDNPIAEKSEFKELTLREKVDLIHSICEYRLDAEDVPELLKGFEGDNMRVEPLGKDKDGGTYWYFYGSRLYKEDPPPKKEISKEEKRKKDRERKKELEKKRKEDKKQKKKLKALEKAQKSTKNAKAVKASKTPKKVEKVEEPEDDSNVRRSGRLRIKKELKKYESETSESSSEEESESSSSEEEEEEEEGEETEEEEKPTKNSKKAPAKKTPAKKTPAKKTPAKKTLAKKTPAKQTKNTPALSQKQSSRQSSRSSSRTPLNKTAVEETPEIDSGVRRSGRIRGRQQTPAKYESETEEDTKDDIDSGHESGITDDDDDTKSETSKMSVKSSVSKTSQQTPVSKRITRPRASAHVEKNSVEDDDGDDDNKDGENVENEEEKDDEEKEEENDSKDKDQDKSETNKKEPDKDSDDKLNGEGKEGGENCSNAQSEGAEQISDTNNVTDTDKLKYLEPKHSEMQVDDTPETLDTQDSEMQVDNADENVNNSCEIVSNDKSENGVEIEEKTIEEKQDKCDNEQSTEAMDVDEQNVNTNNCHNVNMDQNVSDLINQKVAVIDGETKPENVQSCDTCESEMAENKLDLDKECEQETDASVQKSREGTEKEGTMPEQDTVKPGCEKGSDDTVVKTEPMDDGENHVKQDQEIEHTKEEDDTTSKENGNTLNNESTDSNEKNNIPNTKCENEVDIKDENISNDKEENNSKDKSEDKTDIKSETKSDTRNENDLDENKEIVKEEKDDSEKVVDKVDEVKEDIEEGDDDKEDEMKEKEASGPKTTLGTQRQYGVVNPVPPTPSKSDTRWHLICTNLDDWVNLAEWFSNSQVRCEKMLVKLIKEDFLPVLPEIIEAREAERRKRLQELELRRSNRITQKMKDKMKQEKTLVEAEAERRKRLQELELRRSNRITQKMKDKMEQEKILAEAAALEEKEKVRLEEERRLKEEQQRLEEENRQREERVKAREALDKKEKVRLEEDRRLKEEQQRLEEENRQREERVKAREAVDETDKVRLEEERRLKEEQQRLEEENRQREERVKAREERSKRLYMREERARLIAEGKEIPPELLYTATNKYNDDYDSDDSRNDLKSDEDYNNLTRVVDAMKVHRDCWPFLAPVTDEDVPGYSETIKRPMDISKIEEKVKKREYKSTQHFLSDFRLMFNNCKRFNGPESEFTECAKTMEQVLKKYKKRFLLDEPGENSYYMDRDFAPHVKGAKSGDKKYRPRRAASSKAMETVQKALNSSEEEEDNGDDDEEEELEPLYKQKKKAEFPAQTSSHQSLLLQEMIAMKRQREKNLAASALENHKVITRGPERIKVQNPAGGVTIMSKDQLGPPTGLLQLAATREIKRKVNPQLTSMVDMSKKDPGLSITTNTAASKYGYSTGKTIRIVAPPAAQSGHAVKQTADTVKVSADGYLIIGGKNSGIKISENTKIVIQPPGKPPPQNPPSRGTELVVKKIPTPSGMQQLPNPNPSPAGLRQINSIGMGPQIIRQESPRVPAILNASSLNASSSSPSRPPGPNILQQTPGTRHQIINRGLNSSSGIVTQGSSADQIKQQMIMNQKQKMMIHRLQQQQQNGTAAQSTPPKVIKLATTQNPAGTPSSHMSIEDRLREPNIDQVSANVVKSVNIAGDILDSYYSVFNAAKSSATTTGPTVNPVISQSPIIGQNPVVSQSPLGIQNQVISQSPVVGQNPVIRQSPMVNQQRVAPTIQTVNTHQIVSPNSSSGTILTSQLTNNASLNTANVPSVSAAISPNKTIRYPTQNETVVSPDIKSLLLKTVQGNKPNIALPVVTQVRPGFISSAQVTNQTLINPNSQQIIQTNTSVSSNLAGRPVGQLPGVSRPAGGATFPYVNSNIQIQGAVNVNMKQQTQMSAIDQNLGQSIQNVNPSVSNVPQVSLGAHVSPIEALFTGNSASTVSVGVNPPSNLQNPSGGAPLMSSPASSATLSPSVASLMKQELLKPSSSSLRQSLFDMFASNNSNTPSASNNILIGSGQAPDNAGNQGQLASEPINSKLLPSSEMLKASAPSSSSVNYGSPLKTMSIMEALKSKLATQQSTNSQNMTDNRCLGEQCDNVASTNPVECSQLAPCSTPTYPSAHSTINPLSYITHTDNSGAITEHILGDLYGENQATSGDIKRETSDLNAFDYIAEEIEITTDVKPIDRSTDGIALENMYEENLATKNVSGTNTDNVLNSIDEDMILDSIIGENIEIITSPLHAESKITKPNYCIPNAAAADGKNELANSDYYLDVEDDSMNVISNVVMQSSGSAGSLEQGNNADKLVSNGGSTEAGFSKDSLEADTNADNPGDIEISRYLYDQDSGAWRQREVTKKSEHVPSESDETLDNSRKYTFADILQHFKLEQNTSGPIKGATGEGNIETNVGRKAKGKDGIKRNRTKSKKIPNKKNTYVITIPKPNINAARGTIEHIEEDPCSVLDSSDEESCSQESLLSVFPWVKTERRTEDIPALNDEGFNDMSDIVGVFPKPFNSSLVQAGVTRFCDNANDILCSPNRQLGQIHYDDTYRSKSEYNLQRKSDEELTGPVTSSKSAPDLGSISYTPKTYRQKDKYGKKQLLMLKDPGDDSDIEQSLAKMRVKQKMSRFIQSPVKMYQLCANPNKQDSPESPTPLALKDLDLKHVKTVPLGRGGKQRRQGKDPKSQQNSSLGYQTKKYRKTGTSKKRGKAKYCSSKGQHHPNTKTCTDVSSHNSSLACDEDFFAADVLSNLFPANIGDGDNDLALSDIDHELFDLQEGQPDIGQRQSNNSLPNTGLKPINTIGNYPSQLNRQNVGTPIPIVKLTKLSSQTESRTNAAASAMEMMNNLTPKHTNKIPNVHLITTTNTAKPVYIQTPGAHTNIISHPAVSVPAINDQLIFRNLQQQQQQQFVGRGQPVLDIPDFTMMNQTVEIPDVGENLEL